MQTNSHSRISKTCLSDRRARMLRSRVINAFPFSSSTNEWHQLSVVVSDSGVTTGTIDHIPQPSNMANSALRASLGHEYPARRYIYDRCNGSSIYRGESQRPCCYICWVPPPVFAWPATCEQNGSCECIGRTGCCGRENQKARTAIFTVLLLCNFYTLTLTVFANFAASDSISTLEMSNLAEGTVFFETNEVISTVRAFVGLDYVAIRDLGGVIGDEPGERLYSWNEFCGNFTGSGRVEAFPDLSTCQECADAAENLSRLLAFTILASIPMIATNVLRRFPNYDVRLQR